MNAAVGTLLDDIRPLRLAPGAIERANAARRGLPAAVSCHGDEFKAIVALLAHRESQGQTWLGFGEDGAIDIESLADDAAAVESNADSGLAEPFVAHCDRWPLLLEVEQAARAAESPFMTMRDAIAPNTELVIDADRKRLMFARAADNERKLWEAIRSRADAAPLSLTAEVATALEALFPVAASGSVEALSRAEQVPAAKRIMTGMLTVLTGPPGTGKTFTIVRAALGWLCRELQEADGDISQVRRIRLMAPTGRAAARMGELVAEALAEIRSNEAALAALGPLGTSAIERLLEEKPTTIHAALEFSTTQGRPFRRHADNQLEAGLVIVDEASMLGLELARRLFDALAGDTQICLVGDPGQLRAVEIGSVLVDFVAAARRHTELRDSHATLAVSRRFPPGSPIDMLARTIYADHPQTSADLVLDYLSTRRVALDDLVQEHAARMQGGEPPTASNCAIRWLETGPGEHERVAKRVAEMQAEELSLHAYDADISELLKRSVVLCVHRRGRAGADALAMHALRLRQRNWQPDIPIAVDRVSLIVNRNDRALGLANGDLAVVRSESGNLHAHFSTGRVFDLRLLFDYTSAAVLTVHKGQGSEWRRVAVILPEFPSCLATPNMLYTACTRSTQSILLIGPAASLAACLAVKRELR